MQIAEPCLQSFWCWVGFVVVFQSPNCVHLFVTSWTTADQASLSFNYLLKFAQIHVHWIGDAIQPSHPLSSPSPAFNISQQEGLFQRAVLRIRWPKYWNFSCRISPSDEYSGLISFRIDWLDLLAVQGFSPTPQFKSINSSALSFLYSPTLTSIHDHWKNHSFD